MSTILVNKNWQPKPTKNLVEELPVKEGVNSSTMDLTFPSNSRFNASDMVGLSWIFLDDELF